MDFSDRYYKPYTIGQKLFEHGHGISDILGAVKCDEDMEQAFQGYMDAMKKQESREARNLNLGTL